MSFQTFTDLPTVKDMKKVIKAKVFQEARARKGDSWIPEREFKKSIRLLLKPEQQMMWNKVYEVGLINDPDGVLIKLMNFQTELTHFMYPDWEMPDESAPEGARDDGTVKLEFDAQVDDDGNFILDEDGKFVQ